MTHFAPFSRGSPRLPQLTFALCLLCCALLSRHSGAEPAPPRQPPPAPARSQWREHWPTFSLLEGVATVAAGAGTGALLLLKPPEDPRWTGGILFDDAVRRGTRLESEGARKQARRLGDLPYYASPILPLIVDPLIVSWLLRDDPKAALNLGLVGLEAFSYAGLLSFVSTRISLRERPDSTECLRQQPIPADCTSDTESFYSGHTSIAATSAGLVCANHQYLPLWGQRWADIGACALATTGALATAASRLAADRHYATDVLAGFVMGFGIGYSVPVLLHYTRSKSNLSFALEPGGPCTGACLKLRGVF